MTPTILTRTDKEILAGRIQVALSKVSSVIEKYDITNDDEWNKIADLLERAGRMVSYQPSKTG